MAEPLAIVKPSLEGAPLRQPTPSQPRLLSWLFEAELWDGRLYKQTPDDRSRANPEQSCFTDLMDLVRGGARIRRFGLFRGDEHLVVELQSGRFIVNGMPFFLPSPPANVPLDVWYTRTRTHNRELDLRSGRLLREYEDPLLFNIGWVAVTPQGDYRQILTVV